MIPPWCLKFSKEGKKKWLNKRSRHTMCQAKIKGSRSQARNGRASVWKQRSKGKLQFWLPHCCRGRTERRGELRGHRRLRSSLFCGLACISAAQDAWPSTQLITSELPTEIVPPFLMTSRIGFYYLGLGPECSSLVCQHLSSLNPNNGPCQTTFINNKDLFLVYKWSLI